MKDAEDLTDEERETLKESFRKNKLFNESSSPFKEHQLDQFSNEDEILEGQHTRIEEINGRKTLVIYHFKNGFIHSSNDMPAIEIPMHWEYWNNGVIEKVVDQGGDVEEVWKDGVPVSIKSGLSLEEEEEKT